MKLVVLAGFGLLRQLCTSISYDATYKNVFLKRCDGSVFAMAASGYSWLLLFCIRGIQKRNIVVPARTVH